ncbi:hypothetical protein N7478_013209 [Penicillium angulare]|uniref:uncharacterized protein n=1 Tax=Penicillium angulare TaxID=116970 RepID=UPI00254024A2|nr:uncharacterized protein N7478_013209 [Penicillium angulare]KAJ5257105.1 hypothetical protein N7478_013209 [Penicillium angulare]
MKFKEKVNICLSLSLGIIAGVCGIVRTTGLDALAVSDDYLYAVTESAIWTNSEITLTMICVSVPALRPLYRSLAGRSTSNETSNYNQINPYHLQKYNGQTSHPDYALESLTTTTVHGKQAACDNSATSKHTGIDEGSDDMDTSHILNHQNYDPSVIHQITEVDISYEERKGDVPTVPAKARQHI